MMGGLFGASVPRSTFIYTVEISTKSFNQMFWALCSAPGN